MLISASFRGDGDAAVLARHVLVSAFDLVSGVVEVEPEGGKIARMFAASGEWQAGRLVRRSQRSVGRTLHPADHNVSRCRSRRYGRHDDPSIDLLQAHGGGLFELWRQQYEEIKAKENGHGNGNGRNGHTTPEEMSMQPGADDSRFSRVSWPKSLGKVMTAVPQTQVCTNLECGNTILARYGDGAWRCNAFGASGRDPFKVK